MLPTLFLHIGTHRTATSSIQAFLKSCATDLARKGILVPNRTGRHMGLVNDLFAGRLPAHTLARRFDEQARRLEITTPGHSIVLSDEDISMRADPTPLAALSEHFEVRVIFAMRRQDLWLESWYFQNIKWQWIPAYAHADFDTFLADRAAFHWAHYAQHLEKYAAVFGEASLLPMVFERGQMPEGPVRAFADMIGAQGIALPPRVPHLNASLSAPMAEVARHLPLDTLPDAERHRVVTALLRIDRENHGGARAQNQRLMDDATRRAVLAPFEAGNRAVAQRYFGRDRLFFDPLPDPGAPLADMRLPADAGTLIAEVFAPLIRELAHPSVRRAPRP